MTVFKTFWKVVKKYKGTIILYTVMLIVFGGLNMTTGDSQTSFVDSKPDILIVNHDDGKIVDNLVKYIEDNSNIKDIKSDEESINDALFYRDVNYVIYIPDNYNSDVLERKNPIVDIKSTGDYQASLAEMMLTRYIKVQNIYASKLDNEDKIIEAINSNLSKKSDIEITSKLDYKSLERQALYFNFATYSIMAVIIFVVSLVLSSFNEMTVKKRRIISSMNYKKHNRRLLISSFMYSIIVWVLFVVVGIFLVGDVLLTTRGFIYMLNSFIFTFCSLTIALLISTLLSNKEAISGIVNVIALGSAFLCGAFVPAEWLPVSVLKIARVLPAYWYINSNNLLKTMEVINMENLEPVFINMIVIIVFSVVFIIVNNAVSRRKQKVG